MQTLPRTLLRYSFLLLFKLFARLLWRFEVTYVDGWPADGFKGSRIGIFLNHTSLFEPVFLAVLPYSLLWTIARYGIVPGADITMNRPIAGRFFRLLAQDTVSITRKRDSSWDDFLGRIHSRSLVLIAPEGRMKRRSGLDKEGKPMTVRSGVVDVLRTIGSGKGILVYSGCLHHVHAPGDKYPKLFKTIRVVFEAFDIEGYLRQFEKFEPREQRRLIATDLERRRDEKCPRA